jgi:hypothetical protein
MKKQKLSTESKKNGRPAGDTGQPRNERTEQVTVDPEHNTSPEKSKAKASKNKVKKPAVTGLVGGDASKTSPATESLNLPGISDEIAARAGIRKVGALEAKDLCGLNVNGLWIPYFDEAGKPVMIEDEDGNVKQYGRLRMARPEPKKKYHQLTGSGVHLYIPHGDYRDITRLVIVEGEKKSLSLSSLGIPAVGISGFYGFQVGVEGKKQLLQELQDIFILAGDSCEIEFLGDSDTVLNYQFADAAVKLSHRILEGTGRSSMTLALPRIPINAPKGVDDLIDHWQKQGKDPVNEYEKLERVTFAADDYPLKSGAAALRWIILETEDKLNGDGLEAAIQEAPRKRDRLFELLYKMEESPSDLVKAKKLSQELIGVGARDLDKGIKQAKERLIEGFSEEEQDGGEAIGSKVESAIHDAYKFNKEYVYSDSENNYQKYDKGAMTLQLRYHEGMSIRNCPCMPDDMSTVEVALSKIDEKPPLHYFGNIGGYEKGVYEMGGNRVIVPTSRPFVEAVQGECPTWEKAFKQLMGFDSDSEYAEEQLIRSMGWLKQTRKAMRDPKEDRQSQVYVWVGETDSGKSWGQKELLPKLIGRQIFLTAENVNDKFNDDMIAAELINLSDASGKAGHEDRNKFTQRIKQLIANPEGSVEAKFRGRVCLPQRQRFVVSCNPDGIAALPTAKGSFKDKVIMVSVGKLQLFDGSDDPKKAEVMANLDNELPAFLWMIDNYEVPKDRYSKRYGIEAWQHPELAELANDGKPSDDLAEDILDWMDKWRDCESKKEMTVQQLFHELYGGIYPERKTLARSPYSLGNYLKHILSDYTEDPDSHPFVIEKRRTKLRRYWVFRFPPEQERERLETHRIQEAEKEKQTREAAATAKKRAEASAREKEKKRTMTQNAGLGGLSAAAKVKTAIK